MAALALTLWPAAASAADWQVRVEEPTGGGHVELRTEVPAVDYDTGRMWVPNGAFVDWSVPYVYWAWNPQVPFCPGACTFDFPSNSVHPLLSGPPYPNRRVFLVAVPDAGWYVSSWTGICAGAGTQCEVGLGQSGLTSVNFSRCPQGQSCLTVRGGPGGLGTLTVRTGTAAGPVIGTCTALCTYNLPAGTTAVVTGAAPGGAVVGSWTGCTVGPSDRCTVTVNGDTRIAARFQYPLVVDQPSPFMAVAVDGPDGYLGMCDATQPSCTYLIDPGGRARLHRFVSIPSLDMNYRFSASWAGCTTDVGDDGTCTTTVNGPTTVQARYASEVRLQVDTPAHVRITSDPAGIDCGTGSPGTCAAWFPLNAFVELSSVADAGWTVAGWQSGECISLTADCTVELDEPPLPARVTTYAQVRVNVVGAGQVDVGGVGIPCAATAPSICFAAPPSPSVLVTRNPRPNSAFDGWTNGGVGCVGTGTCNVVADAPRTITATFSGYYPLYPSSDSLGSVAVASSAPAHHCSFGTCYYAGGTVVTLTETPNGTWAFQDWTSDSGACTGTNHVCTIVMGEKVNGSGEVRAHASHWAGNLVTTAIVGQGSVVSDPSGLECAGPLTGCADYVLGGSPRRFVATPAAGWSLTGWTGVCSGTTNPCVTALNVASVALGATFADVTAPIATFVSRTPAGPDGWNTGAVTVTWSCADVGTGVVAGTVSATLSGDGANQTAQATCADGAGNETVASLPGIDIDTGAPLIAATPSREPDLAGWNREPFAVTWAGSAVSGMAGCDDPTLYTGPAAGVGTLHGSCTSTAGASAQGDFAFKYDPTPPVLLAPAIDAEATDPAGVVVGTYPGLSASDALSSAVVACTPAAPHRFAIGTTTVSCTATDAAGNVAARSFEVRVASAPDLALAAAASSLQQGGAGSVALTVRNHGTGPTSGGLTLSATLPAGLSVRGLAGDGWSCDAGALTCAREDALAPGAAYPGVTVEVTAAADAPASLVVVARVAGGGEPAGRAADDEVATTIEVQPAASAPPPVAPPATTPPSSTPAPRTKAPAPLALKATAKLDARAGVLVVKTTLSGKARVVLTWRTKAGRTIQAWTRTVPGGASTIRLTLPRGKPLPKGTRVLLDGECRRLDGAGDGGGGLRAPGADGVVRSADAPFLRVVEPQRLRGERTGGAPVRCEWDVCAVQEVTTPEAFDTLAATVNATGYSARPLLPEATSRDPRYVSGLLVRRPWCLTSPAVLDVPSPERSLHAVATLGDHSVVVGSMALPPGSSPAWGVAKKVEQAIAIADGWRPSRARSCSASMGTRRASIDSTTPRRSTGTSARSNSSASSAGIRCETSTARWSSGIPCVRRPPPSGGGATCSLYRRGRGDRAVDCRYDVILASRDVRALDAGYLMDEAVAAGSDHALVWADLEGAAAADSRSAPAAPRCRARPSRSSRPPAGRGRARASARRRARAA